MLPVVAGPSSAFTGPYDPAAGKDSGVLIPEARVIVSRANFELSEPLPGDQHYCALVLFITRKLETKDCSIIHTANLPAFASTKLRHQHESD